MYFAFARRFSATHLYLRSLAQQIDSYPSRLYSSINQYGFQLLELIIAMAIISILAGIAYPSYTQYADKANNETAAADIQMITLAIERYFVNNNQFPDNLAQIGLANHLDPWGKPYQYLRIAGANLNGNGLLRKDKSLVPVNSDYDLYSMGKDGASAAPFTAKNSHDDIVRANNGGYIGPAIDY